MNNKINLTALFTLLIAALLFTACGDADLERGYGTPGASGAQLPWNQSQNPANLTQLSPENLELSPQAPGSLPFCTLEDYECLCAAAANLLFGCNPQPAARDIENEFTAECVGDLSRGFTRRCQEQGLGEPQACWAGLHATLQDIECEQRDFDEDRPRVDDPTYDSPNGEPGIQETGEAQNPPVP